VKIYLALHGGNASAPDAVVGRGWGDNRLVGALKPLEGRRVIVLSDMASALCRLDKHGGNAEARPGRGEQHAPRCKPSLIEVNCIL
jgi:hypothetical protein